MSIATPYLKASTVANNPDSIFWLEKGSSGRTTVEDIQDALREYETNFNAGNVSKAEILTLHRAFPDSPTYKQAAVGIQKMDMVDPMVIGGPASIEMIDREGHLITTNALNKAFQKFMGNQRTRNVMVLHSDVQVGWALPAYISKGGQIFKSGVGENGLFFICELRDDTAIAKKVADQINNGLLKSYSIAGSATKIQNMKKGLTPYMQVDEMELAEVTVCEKGVNQGASFEILKAELPQTGKVDKDQCGYRDATAPEEKLGINCGHCKYFNSETRTCDVVVGDIMPGDYCRLFEAGEEDKPQIQVHRKIVIMRSDNTGKINFNKSFANWMEKEEDPLKSGKSFHTLNNIAGREAEHHRLLQEYGFPSEVPLDSMRYTPVVETETDDDGKPIHLIPPWVVNEAGEFLGDKLDEDAPSFKKSIEIFSNLLQKKDRKFSRRELLPAQEGETVYRKPLPRDNERMAGGGRPVKPYKRSKQPPIPNPQDEEYAIDKAPIGVSQTDPSDPSRQQAPKPQAPENQYQIGQNQPAPNVPAPNTGASTAPPPKKQFYPDELVPQQPMTQREQRGKEFGEMRRGADQPWGRVQRAFKAGKRGAGRSLDRQADRLGRGISYLDRGRKNIGGGITDTLSGVQEGAGAEPETLRSRDFLDVGDRKPSAARNIGRAFGRYAGRRPVQGARGAYRAGAGAARGLAGKKGDEQPRDESALPNLGRTPDEMKQAYAERDRERVGGVGSSGTRGYRAGRALREFGRGAIRSGTAGEENRARDAADTTRWQGRGAREGGRESAAEKVGKVFGRGARGLGRQAANIATTPAKVVGAGLDAAGAGVQEVQRVRGERKEAEATAQRRQARKQAKADHAKSVYDAQMQGERIGEGAGAFRPSLHEGLSASEKHDDVGRHIADIGTGRNLSPKDWMSVIHHLSQNQEGQRFANFHDIDIPREQWHGSQGGEDNRISASDMRVHIQRMVDNGKISFGEHGGEGQRALDSIMGKLENSHKNREQMQMKRLNEARSTGLDEDDAPPREQQQEQRERQTRTTDDRESGSPDELQARERNRRQREAEDEKSRRGQGYGPNPMDLDWGAEKAPVHKTFAKAFGLSKTRR